jgi:hypothetical protein
MQIQLCQSGCYLEKACHIFTKMTNLIANCRLLYTKLNFSLKIFPAKKCVKQE